jgi:ATP-binding cassette, subfamily B, multidrug efflux pump
VWFALYGALVHWTIRNVGPASKAAADARSEVTGRVVDSYTNIHSVKMFAHHDRELDYAKDAIENTRRTFQKEMRIYTIMDLSLTVLNGVLIVGVVGWAIYLWGQNLATGRRRRRGDRADAAAERHDRLDHVGGVELLPPARRRRRGDGNHRPADHADRQARRAGAERHRGRIAFHEVSHHYGRGAGGLDRLSLTVRARREDRPDRALRRGEIDAREAAAAVLRPRIGPDRDRWSGHHAGHAGQPAPADRHGQQDSALLHRSIATTSSTAGPRPAMDEVIAAARRPRRTSSSTPCPTSRGAAGTRRRWANAG